MALGNNKPEGISGGKKGFAIRKLKRGQDGTWHVIFVDSKSGKEVSDPDEYNIITSGQTVDPNLQPAKEEKKKEEKPSVTSTMMNPTRSDQQNSFASMAAADRSVSNDFGYINKPGFMSFADMLPGPVGFVGKVANVGMNVNNTVATNDARAALGLEKKSFLGDVARNLIGATGIGSKLISSDGYVGDISINGTSTPVGFEAQDKYGRTTLTVAEAQKRMAMNPSITESPQTAIDQARDAAKTANGSGGLISRVFDGAKSLFSDMFDTDRTTESGRQGGSYPSAPSGNVSKSDTEKLEKQFNDYTKNDSSGGGGWQDSKQARDAVSSGKPGLF